MTRTHEQFMSNIDAILARYIAGGYEPEEKPTREPAFIMNTVWITREEAEAMFPPTRPGCRVTLDNKLICPCNPEAAAQHNNTNEGEGNV